MFNEWRNSYSARVDRSQRGTQQQQPPRPAPQSNTPSWYQGLFNFFAGSAQTPPPAPVVASSNSSDDAALFRAFFCPIDIARVMVDPVILIDVVLNQNNPPIVNDTGYTFERASIERWSETCLQENRSFTNPLTNERLYNPHLIPNRALADTIKAHISLRYTHVLRIAPNNSPHPPEITNEKHIILRQTNADLTAYWLDHNQRVTWASLPLLQLSQQFREQIPGVGRFSNDSNFIHHIVSNFGCFLEKPKPLSLEGRQDRIREEANRLINYIHNTLLRNPHQIVDSHAADSFAATTFTYIRKTQLGLLNNPDICGIPQNIAQKILEFVLNNPVLLSAHELPQFCKTNIEVPLNHRITSNQDRHTPEVTSTPLPRP